MEVWLDTCDSKSIDAAMRFGIIYGITSNPTILAEAGKDPEKVIQQVLDIQEGPLAVQVTADQAEEMIQQAEALHAFSKRIIVKVPVTKQGLIAMSVLSKKGIQILATAVFEPRQALFAAIAGVQYVAPYVGRMFDAGIDAYTSLQTMVKMFQQHKVPTKIMAAALKNTDQIVACAEMGIEAVTLKNTLFQQFVADEPLSMDCLRVFERDWGSRELPGSLVKC